MRCVEIGAAVASVPTEDRPRDGRDQRALHFADQISAQEVRTAGSLFPQPPGPVIEEGREPFVYLVQVAGWILVEDDDIGAQPFQAQEYWRLKGLSADVVILNEDRY